MRVFLPNSIHIIIIYTYTREPCIIIMTWPAMSVNHVKSVLDIYYYNMPPPPLHPMVGELRVMYENVLKAPRNNYNLPNERTCAATTLYMHAGRRRPRWH